MLLASGLVVVAHPAPSARRPSGPNVTKVFVPGVSLKQAQVIESFSGSLRAGRAGSTIALIVSQAVAPTPEGHEEIAVSRSPGPEFPIGKSLVVIASDTPLPER